MAKYTIYFKSSAEKELYKLDEKTINQLMNKIDFLSINPRTHGAIKLKGEIAYRLRVGNYRIVYEIDDFKKTVTIFRVKHRKDVYKDL